LEHSDPKSSARGHRPLGGKPSTARQNSQIRVVAVTVAALGKMDLALLGQRQRQVGDRDELAPRRL
jgi:hypothetical protein